MFIKMGKLVIISDDYHDIRRVLFLTIIVDSKNWMILIIIKENIMVIRRNQLIAHPYLPSSRCANVMRNKKSNKQAAHCQAPARFTQWSTSQLWLSYQL